MDEDELNIKERDLSIKAGEKQSMVFASKVKAVNSEKGTVDVIMSDASIDRYNEVIDPRAWKKGLAKIKTMSLYIDILSAIPMYCGHCTR